MIDPFTILAVHRTASKQEILRQVAQVLRTQTVYDAHTVSLAQKILFSPLDRAEAEFIHCWDATDLLETPPLEAPEENIGPAFNQLEPLDEKRVTTS